MGTPEMAVPPLESLEEAGYDIVLVVTRPDAKRGRGGAVSPSPVKRAAQDLGLAVSHDVEDVLEVNAELGVVVAFGQIIKPHVLDNLAMINMHFSLLPRWRGAAPVERAILAGDAVTGVCIMVLEEELDVGAIYRRVEVPIPPAITVGQLRRDLVEAGSSLLIEALDEGLGAPEPQNGDVVWAAKIQPDEMEMDWSEPALQLARLVRLEGAWTTLDGKRLKVIRAVVGEPAELKPGEVEGTRVGTGDGALELVEVQPEGKQSRAAVDWARGARLRPTTRLGT